MKKKNIVIAILIILMLAGYYIFNNIFPVAKPIQHTPTEDILSIKILTHDNKEGKISDTDFGRMSSYISNSKPTRIMSNNDSPTVIPYYKVEVSTKTKNLNYFIYENNDKVFIEIPYEGVYLADRQILNMVD